MGPLAFARAAEEHGGPHSAGSGIPPSRAAACCPTWAATARAWLVPAHAARTVRSTFLVPETVLADVGLLKWGQPRCATSSANVTASTTSVTPAEDFATGVVTYRNPETEARAKAQFTVSWMYDKQGLRLLVDGLGPGYALEANSLRSPLEIFIGDAAAASVGDAELALEKSTASQGLLAVQPNEADLYGYTDENVEALAAFPRRLRRPARLRLRARGRPAHHGRVPLRRAGARGRPDRRCDAPRCWRATCR